MLSKALTLTTAPSIEPVTTADALAFMRVDNQSDAALVAVLVAAACEVVELATGRALISQGWRLTLPNWQSGYPENFAADYAGATIMSRTGVLSPYPVARRVSSSVIILDKSPLITVDTVKYYDSATETLTTFSAANYYALTTPEPGAVALKPTASWPDLYDRPDAVQINFTAGYGTTAASVPANLRMAVMILAKHYYDGGRELVDVKQAVSEIPLGVRHVMESRKVEGWVS